MRQIERLSRVTCDHAQSLILEVIDPSPSTALILAALQAIQRLHQRQAVGESVARDRQRHVRHQRAVSGAHMERFGCGAQPGRVVSLVSRNRPHVQVRRNSRLPMHGAASAGDDRADRRRQLLNSQTRLAEKFRRPRMARLDPMSGTTVISVAVRERADNRQPIRDLRHSRKQRTELHAGQSRRDRIERAPNLNWCLVFWIERLVLRSAPFEKQKNDRSLFCGRRLFCPVGSCSQQIRQRHSRQTERADPQEITPTPPLSRPSPAVMFSQVQHDGLLLATVSYPGLPS